MRGREGIVGRSELKGREWGKGHEREPEECRG